MPNEPTLGEVVRRLEAVHIDLKDDMHELAKRLDGKVSQDVLRLEQKSQDDAVVALVERVKDLEAAAKERDQQRAADRRLVLTGLIVPILLVMLQAYLAARGAGR